jgi:hypothetical protein
MIKHPHNPPLPRPACPACQDGTLPDWRPDRQELHPRDCIIGFNYIETDRQKKKR